MEVKVGILSCSSVNIRFNGLFLDKDTGESFRGSYIFSVDGFRYVERLFVADNPDCSSFDIDNVIIGKDFHWQREEQQQFKGSLLLRSDGKQITVVNILPVELYLKSVISSEMSANSSLEFLKAHAIISRTWVMNRILNKRHYGNPCKETVSAADEERTCLSGSHDDEMIETETERICWHDDSEHSGFDVCADDHCQRYQGVTRISNPTAIEAVESTKGVVLTYNGEIIDARFSKCCGGAFELFENCWQQLHHPYLKEGRDCSNGVLPDLSDEANARAWIEGNPDAFCNTHDEQVLKQVLNDYDRETHDFYRWNVDYSAEELSQIVKNRSGIDFGIITDLIPLQCGVSGRIVRLKIVGTKRVMTIGKELEIRKTLSPSHLYSSAFTVDKNGDRFSLHGAGWGHGVGLCQIGAAMMAHKGFSHTEILSHYYPGTTLSTF